MVGIETKFKKVHESGKRKSAVARAIMESGNGKVTFNGRDISSLDMFNRLSLEEPLRIAESVLGKIEFNCKLLAKGGGEKGQIDASRLALAKAILAFNNSEELRNALTLYDRSLLVADVRRKETRKPGDSKARAKRQTSFR